MLAHDVLEEPTRGPNSANTGRLLPMIGQFVPTSARLRNHQSCGRSWPDLCQCRPNMARVRQSFAESGHNSEFGLDQLWLSLGRFGPIMDRARPTVADLLATVDQSWAEFGPRIGRPRTECLLPTFAEVGPRISNFAKRLADPTSPQKYSKSRPNLAGLSLRSGPFRPKLGGTALQHRPIQPMSGQLLRLTCKEKRFQGPDSDLDPQTVCVGADPGRQNATAAPREARTPGTCRPNVTVA